MTTVYISGNTYQHRETFKDMGARWDAAINQWYLPAASSRDLERLRSIPGIFVRDQERAQPEPRPLPPPPVERKPSKPMSDNDILKFIFGVISEDDKPGSEKPNVFGDRTWLNHFAPKNPTSYFGFSSLSAMVKMIKAIPDEIINDNRRNQGWSTGDHKTKWTRTQDMNEALSIANNGWKEGVELAGIIADKLTGRHAIERRAKYSVAGGSVNVGRMLAGNPLNMRSRPKQPGKKIITFFASVTASASVSPDDLIVRAAVIAAMVNILEMSGYSCEIVAPFLTSENGRAACHIVTTLKQAGEQLNLNDIIFGLGHPSYLRRLCFAVAGTDDDLSYLWSGMGVPVRAFNDDHQTAQSEYYIKNIKHGTSIDEGDSLIDHAMNIWDIVTDKALPIDINREE